MQFDTAPAIPTVKVSTYSSHYNVLSDDLAEYAAWYKAGEQPDMTDEQFREADSYTIALRDFKARFGEPRFAFSLTGWLDSATQ